LSGNSDSEPEPDSGRSPTLEGAIREITSLTGVSALLIANERGEVQNQWYRTLLDRSKLDVTGLDITELIRAAVDFVGRIGGVMLENIVLNSENSIVLVQSAGRSALLVLSDKRANTGLLAMRAKRIASIIASRKP
jgi:predicted regulator of Ras-like GTPase activity (Roadblock/LC7/MglB family)